MAKTNPVEVQEEKIQEPAADPAAEAVKAAAELAKLKAENEKMKAQLAEAQAKANNGPNRRETDYDRVHRIERECIAAGKNPWDEKVEVFVPRKSNRSEDPWYWINVNGRPVQFPANDTFQEIRLPWACVLVDTLRNESQAEDYKNSLKVYDPKINPHDEEVIRSGS